MSKFRSQITKPVGEQLEFFHTPLIHLGGAGLHYPKGQISNGYIIKPGPLPYVSRLEHTKTGMDPGIEFDFDPQEYEGEWFDSGDVEGYLEAHGIRINPQSSYMAVTLSEDSPIFRLLGGSTNVASPPVFPRESSNAPSTRTNSTATTLSSPHTPQQIIEPPAQFNEQTVDFGNGQMFPELGGLQDSSWMNDSNAAMDWLMGAGDRTPDFLNSGWVGVQEPSSWDFADAIPATEPTIPMPATQTGNKRTVTLDVWKMIDGKFHRSLEYLIGTNLFVRPH
jgi:hypothetical protein